MNHKTYNNDRTTLANFPQAFHDLPFPENEDGNHIINQDSLSALTLDQQILATRLIAHSNNFDLKEISESFLKDTLTPPSQSFYQKITKPFQSNKKESQLRIIHAQTALLCNKEISDDDTQAHINTLQSIPTKTALDYLALAITLDKQNSDLSNNDQLTQLIIGASNSGSTAATLILADKHSDNQIEFIKYAELAYQQHAQEKSKHPDEQFFNRYESHDLTTTLKQLYEIYDQQSHPDKTEILETLVSLGDQESITRYHKLKTTSTITELLSHHQNNPALTDNANEILSDFTSAFNSNDKNQLFTIGAKTNYLEDSERKSVKAEVMSILLTTNTKLFNVFADEIDILINANLIEDTSTLSHHQEEIRLLRDDPQNLKQIITHRQAKIRSYLKNNLLPNSQDLDLSEFIPKLTQSLDNPGEAFANTPLFISHNQQLQDNLKGNILSRIDTFNSGSMTANKLEMSRWFELYLSSVSIDKLKDYKNTYQNNLLHKIAKDINTASSALDGRIPFKMDGRSKNSINYNAKGGTSDIAFKLKDKYYGSDVTLAQESSWEGNQFIRHHSDLVNIAINQLDSEKPNPLLDANTGNFKQTITKDDISAFIKLSQELGVNYSIVPTVGAVSGDENINEKAAAYVLASSAQHTIIGNTRMQASALDHYFSNTESKFFHNCKYASYLNPSSVNKTLKNLKTDILTKNNTINWNNSNGSNRINLVNARLFVLKLLDEELEKSPDLESALKNMQLDIPDSQINKMKEDEYFKSFSNDTRHHDSSLAEKSSISTITIDAISKNIHTLISHTSKNTVPAAYNTAQSFLDKNKLQMATGNLQEAYENDRYQPALEQLVDLAKNEADDEKGYALNSLMEMYDNPNVADKEIAHAIYRVMENKVPDCSQEYLDKAIQLGYEDPKSDNSLKFKI